MKGSMAVALLAIAFCAPATAQELDRDIHYAGAMASFERGDFAAAAEALEVAIYCDPIPEAGKNEYLPYVYLAAAQYEQGQYAVARAALVQSQLYGVSPKTKAGAVLLKNYAGPIMEVDLDPREVAEVTGYFSDLNESEALSLADVDAIRSQVLRRCALSSRVKESKLPWYFHYEFGMELMAAGDAERALASLNEGARKRMESGRDSRMYGMWFIDYLPYYQMALAHSRLGNWERAQDAIRTSHNFGEFTPSDPDYELYTSLERLIGSKLEGRDS